MNIDLSNKVVLVTGDPVDDAYLVAEATIRYRNSGKLVLWLAIDNVFDANREDAPGFPAPGLAGRLGAELRF